MKKFFKGLKTDVKFAKAGEGHKLTDDTRTYQSSSNAQSSGNVRSKPMTASQVQAASAAMARHDQQAKQTKTVVPKVIRNKKTEEEEATSSKATIKKVESQAESSLKFHSPFGKEIIQKSDYIKHIHENLIMQLSSDGVQASCLMIRTLNKNKEKIDIAVRTLHKYVDNVITHPDEEKYLRIRRNNKVFSDRVAVVEGCEEFLGAIGFKRMMEGAEMIFVMTNVDVNMLEEAKITLDTTEAIKPTLYRDTQILELSDSIAKVKVSDDFFELSSQEVKQLADERSEEVELSQQLRTKAMREGKTQKKKFLFTIIRVKFPEGCILQGTFMATNTVQDLIQFVRDNLNVEWAIFTLETALRETIDKEEMTLQEANLVPTAVLNLIWNDEIKIQIQEQQGVQLALKR